MTGFDLSDQISAAAKAGGPFPDPSAVVRADQERQAHDISRLTLTTAQDTLGNTLEGVVLSDAEESLVTTCAQPSPRPRRSQRRSSRSGWSTADSSWPRRAQSRMLAARRQWSSAGRAWCAEHGGDWHPLIRGTATEVAVPERRSG